MFTSLSRKIACDDETRRVRLALWVSTSMMSSKSTVLLNETKCNHLTSTVPVLVHYTL
jgi:hypothetical protein